MSTELSTTTAAIMRIVFEILHRIRHGDLSADQRRFEQSGFHTSQFGG
jgi:hypothetical protein